MCASSKRYSSETLWFPIVSLTCDVSITVQWWYHFTTSSL